MGSAGRDACSHGQIVNTRLLGDVRLCSHVCLHKRYAMCDRFSPVVKTSVLRARHQSSRWLSSADISATASPFLFRRSAQAADGICFSDVRPRVCCRRASLGDRVCSQGHPCREGWTTAWGEIGFVNANCSISPAPACPSGIGSGRAQGRRKAGRGRPAVET
jgi:hypothetical protein